MVQEGIDFDFDECTEVCVLNSYRSTCWCTEGFKLLLQALISSAIIGFDNVISCFYKMFPYQMLT